MTFHQSQNIYCIGIGGIGVSAVARLAKSRGKQVAGSDITESTITKALLDEGIRIDIGEQKGEDIPAECDLIVYSSAVPHDNLQRAEAVRRGTHQMSYPEVLGEIAQSHATIAIAGMHGKSTTTAMLGLVAHEAGLNPLVIVGTLVPQFQISNVLAGSGGLFIVEACEFSGHFQTITPDYLIITNIDADHLDYFKNQKNIDAAFLAFAKKCKKKIIACADDAGCRRVLSDLPNVVWYGEGGEAKDFPLSLQIPGRHNRMNALGVLALAQELGIDTDVTKKALYSFTGTWRRFELVGEYHRVRHSDPSLGSEEPRLMDHTQSFGQRYQDDVLTGIPVISDYAHHPKEIEATIQAARETYPDKRIVVVFQPHQRNRTQMLFNDFVRVLSLVDALIVCEVYDVAGREHGENISSQQIVDAVETCGNRSLQTATYAKDLQTAETLIRDIASPNDLIIIMGAGDIDAVARNIVLQ